MLIEKNKIDTIKLVELGEAYMVEIRYEFPGDVYIFTKQDGKWVALRNGQLQGTIEKRDVIGAISRVTNAMISVAWRSIDWADNFIEYTNAVINVFRKQCFLRFHLTDGTKTVDVYDMPIRGTNVFKVVVAAREKKFDTIEYQGSVYKIIAYDKMRIQGKYVFRLTLDKK